MPEEKKDSRSPVIYIHVIGFFFLAAAFAINPLRITRAFFSDEAVYYTMAYSFVEDGDMTFEQKDLARVYREFAAGPQGILLKVNERDHNIVFAKSFLYSLVASPFVKVFGTRGFFVLHAMLVWLNLLCAYRLCSSFLSQRYAALFASFYFLANATLVYIFWMTPEYFNMSLVCFGFFFFVSGERLKSESFFFRQPWNYWLAAVFFAMATYSKPTNGVLVVPLGTWMLFQRKVQAALVTAAIYVLVTVALFGVNVYFTGEWNYQLGEKRASFTDHYPYDRAGASPFAAFQNKRTIQAGVKPPFSFQALLYNWPYFFFGRFSGLGIYFFPMLFGIVYFWFMPKTGLSTAAYVAGWLGVLTYMLGFPWNYFGGSGTLGNRYLINAFSAFLFVFTAAPRKPVFAAATAFSLLFTSAFLFAPVLSSFNNYVFQSRSLFRLLPVEQSLLADLPINSNPAARRVSFDPSPNYLLYFVDDGTYYRDSYDHQLGFWVKGGRSCEFVLRAFQPVSRVKIRLKSPAERNHVVIETSAKKIGLDLDRPVFYEGEIPVSKPFRYNRDGIWESYLYLIRISSEKGAILSTNGQPERYLGVFIRLELPEIKQKVREDRPTQY